MQIEVYAKKSDVIRLISHNKTVNVEVALTYSPEFSIKVTANRENLSLISGKIYMQVLKTS